MPDPGGAAMNMNKREIKVEVEVPEELLKHRPRPLCGEFFLLENGIVARPFVCPRCGKTRIAYGTSKTHAKRNMEALIKRCSGGKQ